ncbi:MAG: galactose mutarotase [Bacteroidales bacterium]|nr:galactose mutarotase [Bacteroidales bacterium]MCL2133315.1 galactose mutarotase [Bacteroidales bacterium]
MLPLLPASAFKAIVEGKSIGLYTIKNASLTMQITNFGGRVVSLWVPDKHMNYDDIVVGYNSIEQYLHNKGERFLGCVVGRYANRIAKGKFSLNGQEYKLPINNNGQCLHGGLRGLDSVIFTLNKLTDNEIELSYISPDGEEGFPGTLSVIMTYTLTPDNAFVVKYKATTDKTTVVNLSHHSFFNLKGEGNGLITDHLLTINADAVTQVNEWLIPTGELIHVENTPFDFRTPRTIGERINSLHPQIIIGKGYDHNFVLHGKEQGIDNLKHAATLHEPISGRILEVWTDQPGLQFYSGYHFTRAMGKYGKPHERYGSLALETQNFPDAPNQPAFPSAILQPGNEYQHTCIYKFSYLCTDIK